MGSIVWITGLSGSGKSTIAIALRRYAHDQVSSPVHILDADDVRQNLNEDLGFSDEERKENVRRIGALASIVASLHDHTLVIVPCISPFESSRNKAREYAARAKHKFLEVYVDTPLEECVRRDPKGLYAKQYAKMTGVGSPYEVPKSPDYIADTLVMTPEEIAHYIFSRLALVKAGA